MMKKLILLTCIVIVTIHFLSNPIFAREVQEVIVVREFNQQRNYSVHIIADRIDYNTKGADFWLTGDSNADLCDFVMNNIGNKIKVTYLMEVDNCDFCITKAEKYPDQINQTFQKYASKATDIPSINSSQPLTSVSNIVVDSPIINVGYKYTFEIQNTTDNSQNYIATREITNIDGDRMTVVTTNEKTGSKRTTYYDTKWGFLGSGTNENEGVIFLPALKYLDFPLTVGKKWTAYSVETNKKTGHQRLHTIKGTVAGWEKIIVSAGVFEALRIELLTELKDGENILTGSDVSWYVSDLQRTIKSELTGKDASGKEEKKIIQLLSHNIPQQTQSKQEQITAQEQIVIPPSSKQSLVEIVGILRSCDSYPSTQCQKGCIICEIHTDENYCHIFTEKSSENFYKQIELHGKEYIGLQVIVKGVYKTDSSDREIIANSIIVHPSDEKVFVAKKAAAKEALKKASVEKAAKELAEKEAIAIAAKEAAEKEAAEQAAKKAAEKEAAEQVKIKSKTLVFKKLYIGMPLEETLKVLNSYYSKSKFSIKQIENISVICEIDDNSRYAMGYFAKADENSRLAELELTRDKLDIMFNTKEMTWETFQKTFIDNYNIPHLKYNSQYEALTYDSPDGYFLIFKGREGSSAYQYLKILKTRSVKDATFD